MMGAVIKHLGNAYPAFQLSLFRNIFGLVPSVLILYFSTSWKETGRQIYIKQWKLGLFRGLLIVTAQFCFYISLRHMEFATVSTLALAGPLFVTLLSSPVLKQNVGVVRWIAVVIGFLGIILVLNPKGDFFSLFSILPLCSAFCYASTSVTAPKFKESIPTPVVNMYTLIGALIGSLFMVIITNSFVDVKNVFDWIWLASMGTFGGMGVYFWVSAYRLTEPSNLSPFQYFGIPISFLIGWLVFNEAPFSKLFPGVILIIAGGGLVIWHERSLKT